MTLLNFIRGLFYEPTINIYRECTGREWTLREWVRKAKVAIGEVGALAVLLAVCWVYLNAQMPMPF